MQRNASVMRRLASALIASEKLPNVLVATRNALLRIRFFFLQRIFTFWLLTFKKDANSRAKWAALEKERDDAMRKLK